MTIEDVEAENQALEKHIGRLRGMMPTAAMPVADDWLTIDNAAELLGITTADARTALTDSGLVKDSRGRDCIARKDFDLHVAAVAAGRAPSQFL